MLKKNKTQKRKPKPTDTLLKTSKKKDIELTEKDLTEVSGGSVDYFRKPTKGEAP